MGVDARNILNHQANDTDHRSFAQGIHDMLIAAGALQTSDTGQANLTTITRPTANNVSGYEMFRFNDAEHATLPIYVKIEYATGGLATIPALKVTVGTGTNGAGTINATGLMTGGATNTFHWGNTSETAGQTRPAFAAINNGHFIFAFGMDYVNDRGAVVCIERPKQGDGSRSTDGVIFWGRVGHSNASGIYFGQIKRADGNGPSPYFSSASGQFPSVQFLDWQDDVVGAEVALFPVAIAVNANLRFSAALTYRESAMGDEAVEAVTIFGASRNYRAVGAYLRDSSAADAVIALPYY
jgi:hypothetical protein